MSVLELSRWQCGITPEPAQPSSGRIEVGGTHAELIEAGGTYQRLWEASR